MLFTKTSKLAEIVHQNYLLIPIISRFGIKFGFGDKNVEQVCKQYQIHTDFFIEIINTFNDKEYTPSKKLRELPLNITVNYLLKSHKYFNQVKLPIIENLIHQLKWENADNKNNKLILDKFFNEYRNEVIEHTSNEEKEVYPFILEIEKNFHKTRADEQFLNVLSKKSIRKYADTHDELNSALLDLKNIIIKYLPPADNNEITNQILQEIFGLEKDMEDHTKLEDTVVVPAAVMMEKELRKQLDK
jgi:regulator of cell morphogenesis and NO signaling